MRQHYCVCTAEKIKSICIVSMAEQEIELLKIETIVILGIGLSVYLLKGLNGKMLSNIFWNLRELQNSDGKEL